MTPTEFFEKMEPLMDKYNIQFRQFKHKGEYYIAVSEGKTEVYSSCRATLEESYESAITFLDKFIASFAEGDWKERADAEKNAIDLVFNEILVTYPEFKEEYPELTAKIEKTLDRFGPLSLSRLFISIMIKINAASEVTGWKFDKDAKFLTRYGKYENNDTQFVSVRPCGEHYQSKTYLGILIGSVATGIKGQVIDKEIVISPSTFNPAIYIPETNTIVYGMESWWGNIKSEEDFKEITIEDINNVWYVSALKQLQKKS